MSFFMMEERKRYIIFVEQRSLGLISINSFQGNLFKEENSCGVEIDGSKIKLFRGSLLKPSQLTFAKFSFVLGVVNRNFSRSGFSKFSENLRLNGQLIKISQLFKLFLHHGIQFNWNFDYTERERENLSKRKRRFLTYCSVMSLDLICNAIKIYILYIYIKLIFVGQQKYLTSL